MEEDKEVTPTDETLFDKLSIQICNLLDKNSELQKELEVYKTLWDAPRIIEEDETSLKLTYEAGKNIMGQIGRTMYSVLDEHKALNYVQITFDDPVLNKSYLVTISRSEEQTPHDLKEQALKRVQELETELARYKEMGMR